MISSYFGKRNSSVIMESPSTHTHETENSEEIPEASTHEKYILCEILLEIYKMEHKSFNQEQKSYQFLISTNFISTPAMSANRVLSVAIATIRTYI